MSDRLPEIGSNPWARMPLTTRHNRSATFAPACLAAGLLLLAGCAREPAPGKVTVVFRYDDFSARSNTAIERQIIEAFRARRFPVSFCVIPFVAAGSLDDASPGDTDLLALPPGKIAMLGEAARAGVVDVVQHGCSHRMAAPDSGSEFKGLDLATQQARIRKGQALLEQVTGAPVTTFAPPWNRYDHNTVRALERLGFTAISARSGEEPPGESTLVALPYTCGLPGLPPAIREAQASSDAHPLIVVLFHSYDFVESGEEAARYSFPMLSEALRWLASNRDMRVVSLSQAARRAPRAGN